jgi:hypothetical protein
VREQFGMALNEGELDTLLMEFDSDGNGDRILHAYPVS